MLALTTMANAAAPRRAFVDRMRTAPSLDQIRFSASRMARPRPG
jgi:hypothetical protein